VEQTKESKKNVSASTSGISTSNQRVERFKPKNEVGSTDTVPKWLAEDGASSRAREKKDGFAVISLSRAVKTALRIPERILATPHSEYIAKIALSLEARLWDEETPHVVKLGKNQMLINDKLVNVNYTDFITEADFELKYDPGQGDPHEIVQDQKYLPPTTPILNKKVEGDCSFDYCRLGCICSSLSNGSISRGHCGKQKCFFECCCLFKVNPTLTDSGDIRSRLRPRVTLLNWRSITRFGDEDDEEEGVSKPKVIFHLRSRSLLAHNSVICSICCYI
jgi:hypothetical protein